MLVFHAQPIPRTHDLEHLLGMIGQWIPQIQERREALRWLTTFAVASRYPVETVEVVDEPQAGVHWILPKPFAGIASPT